MTKISSTKVSVIITAHNEEIFIHRCLRSIMNQTLASDLYEVIVVNDASADRTQYILDLFDDSVNCIKNKNNVGLPASINLGIRKARGEYVIRLDADDYVNENYLNFLMLFLDFNGHYDAVACDYLAVDDNQTVLERFDAIEQPIGCGIMFKRSQLLELGLYDESFLRHEDKDLRLRFDKAYKMGHLNIPLYRYRKHLDNITNDEAIMAEEKEKLKDKHSLSY